MANQTKKLFFTILAIGAFISLMYTCNVTSNSNSSTSSESTVSSTPIQPAQPIQSTFTLDIRPDGQKAFEKIISDHFNEFKKADNELRQSTARENRRKALEQLNTRTATDWIGTLTGMTTTQAGSAHIEITLNNGLKVSTWNIQATDIGDNTLIPMNSALYTKLSNLKKGAKVKFSGSFFINNRTGIIQADFLKEKSVTLRSAMMNPDFLIKFSDISLLGEKPITTADVNLKAAPSAQTEQITTISKGTEVVLLDNVTSDGWVKTRIGLDEGYINSQFLTY